MSSRDFFHPRHRLLLTFPRFSVIAEFRLAGSIFAGAVIHSNNFEFKSFTTVIRKSLFLK